MAILFLHMCTEDNIQDHFGLVGFIYIMKMKNKLMNKMNHAITEYCEYITRSTFLCMRRTINENPMLKMLFG